MIGSKILVIAPHPDDETIGCGGTIAKVVRSGGEINVVWLTSGERGTETHHRDENLGRLREGEAREAARILGVKRCHFLRQPDAFLSATPELIKRIAKLIMNHRPEIILTTYPDKTDGDHMAAYSIAVRATMLSDNIGEALLCYEVWTPIEDCDYYEDVAGFFQVKLKALSVYVSQLAIFPYHKAIEGLNKYRGLVGIGSEYAESFKVIYTTGDCFKYSSKRYRAPE